MKMDCGGRYGGSESKKKKQQKTERKLPLASMIRTGYEDVSFRESVSHYIRRRSARAFPGYPAIHKQHDGTPEGHMAWFPAHPAIPNSRPLFGRKAQATQHQPRTRTKPGGPTYAVVVTASQGFFLPARRSLISFRQS